MVGEETRSICYVYSNPMMNTFNTTRLAREEDLCAMFILHEAGRQTGGRAGSEVGRHKCACSKAQVPVCGRASCLPNWLYLPCGGVGSSVREGEEGRQAATHHARLFHMITNAQKNCHIKLFLRCRNNAMHLLWSFNRSGSAFTLFTRFRCFSSVVVFLHTVILHFSLTLYVLIFIALQCISSVTP